MGRPGNPPPPSCADGALSCYEVTGVICEDGVDCPGSPSAPAQGWEFSLADIVVNCVGTVPGAPACGPAAWEGIYVPEPSLYNSGLAFPGTFDFTLGMSGTAPFFGGSSNTTGDLYGCIYPSASFPPTGLPICTALPSDQVSSNLFFEGNLSNNIITPFDFGGLSYSENGPIQGVGMEFDLSGLAVGQSVTFDANLFMTAETPEPSSLLLTLLLSGLLVATVETLRRRASH